MKRADYGRRGRSGNRLTAAIGVVAVIVVVVGVLAFYETRATESNTVYCGVFQYLEFPAVTIIGGQQVSTNETMTTSVLYTTYTSVTGHVGETRSNGTTTTNTGGFAAGVDTLCRYISNTSKSG